MAKVAFAFLFSVVLVMSIRTAIAADAPAPAESGGWSPLADKVEGVFKPDDEDDQGSPTGAVDQIRQVAGPAYTSMRGSAQALASQASQAMENAKQDTVTWGDWFKHKLGLVHIIQFPPMDLVSCL